MTKKMRLKNAYRTALKAGDSVKAAKAWKRYRRAKKAAATASLEAAHKAARELA
jgi:hypothetical protein